MRKLSTSKPWYQVRAVRAVGALRALCAMACLPLLFATELNAQERGPLVLRLPASTRALAMGNTFAVGSTDSDGIFYNAAFPDRLRGVSAAVQRWSSRASLYTMSGAIDWWSGGLGVGVRALDYGGGPAAAITAPLPSSEGELYGARTGAIAERAASLAYARRIKGVRGAITAHLIEQRTNEEHNTVAAADVAVGYEMGSLALGLAARNIGPGYELDTREVELPLQLQLSAAQLRAISLAGLDLLPALSLLYEIDGELIPAGGVEVSYWPIQGRTFSLRLGARRAPAGVRPFSAGAGFTGDRLILDYAVVPLENDRFAHRFGVRWR